MADRADRWVPTQVYAESLLAQAQKRRRTPWGDIHNLADGYLDLLATLREIRLLSDPFLDTVLWGGTKRASGDRLDDILLTLDQAMPEEDQAALAWICYVLHI